MEENNEITLAEVAERLDRIESLIRQLGRITVENAKEIRHETEMIRKEEERIEAEEKLIEEEERIIKETEEQIMLSNVDLLKKLGAHVDRKFDNVVDWKHFVWDGCDFKKGKMTDKTIDYHCDKLKSKCRYELCPLNR